MFLQVGIAMKVREFYDFARKNLPLLDEKEAKNEANILLQYCLKLDFTGLFLERERNLTEKELEFLENAISLRRSGVPVQYILGSWEFMNMNLKVGEGVLIPREDTAVLVETVIKNANFSKKFNLIDLCSGTGCVALALEKNLKNFNEIYALEYSKKAFKYLSENIKSLGSKVKAIKGNVFEDYNLFEDDYFDCIVSNPPYIKTADVKMLDREVLHEPETALDGGETGLDFYSEICKLWACKIKSGGILAFEIGQGMHDDVAEIMNNSGFEKINFSKDINGIIRCVMGVKK